MNAPLHPRPLVSVDLFAGGGGASLGIQLATGRSPIVAVNHCAHAIELHQLNHPDTLHFQESVWDVHPSKVVGRQKVDLLWASPDCTHFSRAKGAKPKSKEIRSLAWVIVEWARAVRPRVLAMENVTEFTTWGPLDAEGHAIRDRAGETFRTFVGRLELLGYRVEHRVLVAADYGAPTSRKRFFLVARCDGEPLVWPEPTHGPGRASPWRTAAECIDWSIPCPSIFTRQRPLAEATQRRIAEGIRRYVLEAERPFIVTLTHGGRLQDIDAPMPTVTAAHRGEHALVAPHLVATRNGEREGQAPRVRSVEEPTWTTTATGSQGALVGAFLARHNGTTTGKENAGRRLDAPAGTVTARDTHGLVAAHLVHHRSRSIGRALDQPSPTVTATGGGHLDVAACFLDKLHGSARAGQPLDQPAPTVTAGGGRGGGHASLVAAFLLKYYGQGGQWSGLDEPMHTIVSKARMGLVTVTIAGEEYAIVDIGMRMLQPRELARAQGFPDSYVLSGTKSQRVARIGNSVPPQLVEAIVRAQFGLGPMLAAA